MKCANLTEPEISQEDQSLAFFKAAAENHERVRNAALECKTLSGIVPDAHLPMVKAALERNRLAREGRAPWLPGPSTDFAGRIERLERREAKRKRGGR